MTEQRLNKNHTLILQPQHIVDADLKLRLFPWVLVEMAVQISLQTLIFPFLRDHILHLLNVNVGHLKLMVNTSKRMYTTFKCRHWTRMAFLEINTLLLDNF